MKRHSQGPAHAASPSFEWGFIALLAVVTAWVYSPVSGFQLISYDDPEYITWNIAIQHGLTWEGLKWAFTTGYAGNWHPMTWVSYMLDFQFFGATPGGMHLTSLVLHLLNSALVLLVLRRMTNNFWPSAFVACIFALHPIHVESVAWVCERKDVLSAFFGLLAILAYYHYTRAECRGRTIGFYLLACSFYLLSLMSKPMLVTLPFVLLLLDYWPLNRWRAQTNSANSPIPYLRLFWEKIPFFALTILDSIVTFQTQKAGAAIVSIDSLPLVRRLGNAVTSYLFYLRDTFWPTELSACYPPPPPWPLWQPLLALIVLAGVTLVVLFQRKRGYCVTGWFWFLGTLVPVIGLVQTGAQIRADRFMYFALAGLSICLAWAASDFLRRRSNLKPLLATAALAVIVCCIFMTRRQVAFWKDDHTLFNRALAVTECNVVAHNMLAIALQKEQRFDEAFEHLKEAVRVNPRDDAAYVGMAVYFGNKGDLQSAKEFAGKALQIRPHNPEAHDALGVALLLEGDSAQAETHFERAVSLRPSFAEARLHWAYVLRQKGNLNDAVVQLQEALRFQPGSAEIKQALDEALLQSQQSSLPEGGSR